MYIKFKDEVKMPLNQLQPNTRPKEILEEVNNNYIQCPELVQALT